MGVSLELSDFNSMFKTLSKSPVIVNDLATSTVEEKESLDDMISTTYVNTDLMSNEPTCSCGRLTGGYNLDLTCPYCNTIVQDIFDQDLTPLVWMRSPIGVNKLINPVVLNMLVKRFTRSNFSFIEWIINTDYTSNVARPPEVDELLAMGLKRGYNSFVDNFKEYLDMLYSLKCFKDKKDKENGLRQLLNIALSQIKTMFNRTNNDKEDSDPIKYIMDKESNRIFSDYIPLLNKTLMIIEDTKVGVFVDPLIVEALDAIRTISSIDAPLPGFSIRQKENRTAKTLLKLSMFYYKAYHDMLASKNGLFRKHIFGSRNHFSARAVIGSNTKSHKYDEIHIAWGHGCTMLKMHIVNKLMKRGYNPNEANSFVQDCTSRYDPLMDEIFNELINESPDKGIWCFFLRNPSLTRASLERMKITKVKTDITDPTITMSIISVAGFNADFDGELRCH